MQIWVPETVLKPAINKLMKLAKNQETPTGEMERNKGKLRLKGFPN